MGERFKAIPTRASTVHTDILDLAVKESKSGESFQYFARTSNKQAIADPCPVNGAHHWLIEQERRKGLIVGECKECHQPWPQARGKLDPIVAVTPSEYQQTATST